MLIIPPPQSHKRSARNRRPVVQRPAVALNLVSAAFDPGESSVSLWFDRAIEIGSIDPTAIEVDDNVYTGNVFTGSVGQASLIAPATVKVLLEVTQISQGDGVLLFASASTGIVAADDGGTWAGVSGLLLGWPHDSILGVAHSGALSVTASLSDPVTGIGMPGMDVSVDGVMWASPETIDVSDPMHPVFTFGEDVTAATMWRVEFPNVWNFSPDGAPLAGPLNGSIS